MKTPFLLLLISFSLFACRKGADVVTCTGSIYQIGYGFVAFKGFADQDVDTIIRLQYAEGSGFLNPLTIDTLIGDSLLIAHDTTFVKRSDGEELVTFVRGQDTEIVLKSIGKVYRLSNLRYSPETTYSWTSEPPCDTKNTLVRTMLGVAVDGVDTSIFLESANRAFVVLGP